MQQEHHNNSGQLKHPNFGFHFPAHGGARVITILYRSICGTTVRGVSCIEMETKDADKQKVFIFFRISMLGLYMLVLCMQYTSNNT